jgi:hypothetical protein
MGFQICAIPSVVQNSTNGETAVPGTTMDLSQCEVGLANWICSETGHVNGVTVTLQISNDNITWQTSAVSGVTLILAASASGVLKVANSQVQSRYVRLGVFSTSAGNSGQFTVLGGFVK